MLRYDRTRYIALGLPGLVNGLAIPLYALAISTGGSSSHDEFAVPFYLAIALVCALFGVAAMIKRSRDMGFSALGILLGLIFATPLMLLVALVLMFVPSNPSADSIEPPPSPAGLDIWFKGMIHLLLPWMPVLFLRAL